MIKKMQFLLIVMVIGLFMAQPALAQDGLPDLPSTAVEGLAIVLAFVGTWFGSGYIGSYLTDVLKKLVWLKAEDRSRLGGAWAELVVITLSIGLATGANYLGPVAEFLDTSGIWNVIVAATPALYFAYQRYLNKKRAELPAAR